MARLHYNLVRTLLDGAINSTDTTVTFTTALKEGGPTGADIATVASPDVLAIRIDDEILHVTAYTSGALSATVTRGEDDTIAAGHVDGSSVKHVIAKDDLGGSGSGAGELLAVTDYAPASDATINVTSVGSFSDFDATNLAVPFLVPLSGNVIIRLSATVDMNGAANGFWNVRDGSTDHGSRLLTFNNAVPLAASVPFLVTGLTPGASKTFKWGGKIAGGTALRLYVGPTWGAAVMEVLSAP